MKKNEEITLLIKTFIRINCVVRLLESIKKYASGYPIIICDDGIDRYKNKEFILSKFGDMNIEYLITEENIGLAEGRNRMLNHVKTKYFVLCDDDFVFFKNTDIQLAKELIEKENLDILGGLCLHANRVKFGSKTERLQLFVRKIRTSLCFYRKVGYKGEIKRNGNNMEILLTKMQYHSKKVNVTDICENFFIGNTQKVKDVKWNGKLKLNEHEDFFIRAKEAGLKIGVTAAFKVYHLPESNVTFKVHRDKNYYEEVMQSNNLQNMIIYRNNVGIIQNYKIEKGKLIVKQEYTKNLLGKLKKMYYKIQEKLK